LDYGLVRAIQAQVADGLTQNRQQRLAQGLPELSSADERQLGLSLIQSAVSRHLRNQLAAGNELPDGDFDARLVAAVDAAIWGAGELQELLDDQRVENIDINGCDEVWVTYAGRGKVLGRPVAASDADLIDIVRTLGSYAGLNARPFTPSSPELDLRLPDGSRLSAIMSASERPLVSIRRNRFPQVFLTRVPEHVASDPRTKDFATLLELGAVDERLAAFLEAAVLARHNIIVAGATDAGKTTLLRALINCIPPHERLITVERALELGLRRHPHLHWDVAEMEEVLPGSDSTGGVDIGQLVRRTRRQNPSRVIVGEVLGPEVIEMLSAMSQGNDGSLSTIHARSATDVFDRLAVYAAQHARLDVSVTHALVGGAIDFVVFMRKYERHGGLRLVTEVVEVTGSSEGRVTRSRIFSESEDDGRAVRDAEVPIMRAYALAQHGYDDSSPRWHWEGYPAHGPALTRHPAQQPHDFQPAQHMHRL
jgi:Flp pilus assembly CpaF family ATPase